VALLPENSMSLSSVLGHVGVDELHNIVSDGGSEHGWHNNLLEDVSGRVLRVNANARAGSHLSSCRDIK